jgi:repressor LexA
MLTQKQSKLLMFIHSSTVANGFCPTVDEMRVAMEMKSKSGIIRLLDALQDRGFIKRIPNQTSATEVLRLPASQKREWLGTEYPPQLAMEIVRRAAQSNCEPEVVIIHGLRAQFGLL